MMFNIVSYKVEETESMTTWDKGGPEERLVMGERHTLVIRLPSGESFTNSREFSPFHVLMAPRELIKEQLLMEMVKADLTDTLEQMEDIKTYHTRIQQARRGYYA